MIVWHNAVTQRLQEGYTSSSSTDHCFQTDRDPLKSNMNTTNIKPAVVGAILGLLMHHGLFIHGEWHIQAPAILLCHILCFSCLIWILDSAWWIISGYLFTLFSSICIYRLFFHRLSHFPGPLCARITKVWHMWKARACKNHLVLQGLRQRYGDFVRTGGLYSLSILPMLVLMKYDSSQAQARSPCFIPTFSQPSTGPGLNVSNPNGTTSSTPTCLSSPRDINLPTLLAGANGSTG